MSAPKLAEGTRYAPPHLPTMYDLPSEDPQEPGLPDDFHYFQPQLLRETLRSPDIPADQLYVGTDINLYYDPLRPLRYKRPDWFAVLGGTRLHRDGDLRLSYVIWEEEVAPYLVIELLSPGTEGEDLGRTLREVAEPPTKWTVYEQILKIPYYVVYSRYTRELKAFGRVSGSYQPLDVTTGRLWLPEVNLGLGLWEGTFEDVTGKWLRWYDAAGQWVPSRAEARDRALQETGEALARAEAERVRADEECARAEAERIRAEAERKRAERLAARLKALGVDPDVD